MSTTATLMKRVERLEQAETSAEAGSGRCPTWAEAAMASVDGVPLKTCGRCAEKDPPCWLTVALASAEVTQDG